MDTHRRVLSLVVILALLFALAASPVCAEDPAAPAPPAPAPASAGPPPAPPVAANSQPAHDDSLDAAFGLRWFDSKAEVEASGIDLSHQTSTQFGDSYAASYLPRNVPDMEYAVLSFGYNDQLIRITAIGGQYDNDNEARQVRVRYHELQEVLEKKYGKGETDSHIDKTFAGGLTALGFHGNKNWMYTVYKRPNMRIELSVISIGGHRMRWRLIFENLEGMAQLERQRRRSEEAAF